MAQLAAGAQHEGGDPTCSLAGTNTHMVVPMLLNKPLPWDRYLSTAGGHILQPNDPSPAPVQAQHSNHCTGTLSL